MSPFQQFIEAEMKNRKLESLRRIAPDDEPSDEAYRS
jgi:hypothetical protein